jgi:hypothetical protein
MHPQHSNKKIIKKIYNLVPRIPVGYEGQMGGPPQGPNNTHICTKSSCNLLMGVGSKAVSLTWLLIFVAIFLEQKNSYFWWILYQTQDLPDLLPFFPRRFTVSAVTFESVISLSERRNKWTQLHLSTFFSPGGYFGTFVEAPLIAYVWCFLNTVFCWSVCLSSRQNHTCWLWLKSRWSPTLFFIFKVILTILGSCMTCNFFFYCGWY